MLPSRSRFSLRKSRQGLFAAIALVAFASGGRAHAQTTATDDQLHPSLPQQSIASSLPEPLKTLGGARPWLYDRGISFLFNYQSDLLGAVSGGPRRGTTYMGRLEGVVEVDLEKAFGWPGALFHVGAYQIHGMGLSRHFLNSFQPVTDLEALPTTRLNEIWLEQKLGDKVLLRAGQLAADAEFFLTPFHALPVGGAYGWPAVLAQNVPNGGPAYPFASPGVRLKVQPTESIALLAAVYNGDPVGPGVGDPQKRNRNGVNFRMRDPAFAIGEAQFGYKLPFQGELTGNLRLGGWTHFGRFADQRFGLDGQPLASPTSIGLPLQHRGNYGLYATFDQQVFRPGEDATKGVFVYGRLAGAPADRNLVDFYMDGGVNFVGLVPGRPNDQFGFMGAFARISPAAQSADWDARLFNATFGPVRDHEALLQATYQAQILPGWNLQPNIQYVIHPGGHVLDPRDPLGVRAARNALVVGIRSSIKY